MPAGDERCSGWSRSGSTRRLHGSSRLGAPVVAPDTENPRTVGPALRPARAGRGARSRGRASRGSARRSRGDERPLVLATGGFAARGSSREARAAVRANPWSEGDGLDRARPRRGDRRATWTSSTARAMPRPGADRGATTSAGAALRPVAPRVDNERGEESSRSRLRGARSSWRRRSHAQPAVRRGSSSTTRADPKLQAAREAGGEVVEADGGARVHVAAGRHAHARWPSRRRACPRAPRRRHARSTGLYAAGVDAGGIASGRVRERPRARRSCRRVPAAEAWRQQP